MNEYYVEFSDGSEGFIFGYSQADALRRDGLTFRDIIRWIDVEYDEGKGENLW